MNRYEKLWDAITSQQEKASYTLYRNLLAGHAVLYSRERARKYGLTGRTLKFQMDVWKGLETDYQELGCAEKMNEYKMLQSRTARRLAQKNRI